MSSEHQKYSQKTITPSTEVLAAEARDIYNKNGIYYPFQTALHEYYYNYMLPFLEATPMPYFPHAFLPPFQYFPPHATQKNPLRGEENQQTMRQEHAKGQTNEERVNVIKIEHQETPEVKEAVIQPSLPQEKPNNKQLYSLGQLHSKFFQHDNSGLSPRFKKVLFLYIQEVQEQEPFQRLYRLQFPKEREENPSFFEQLMTALSTKIRFYKKTKEELIKFIIRRTYHNLRLKKNTASNKPEYDRLQAFHQKNLATFKSMNIMFLRREFSNPLFIEFYKDFLSNLDTQFQTENQEKVERLSYTLIHCWTERSTKLLFNERKLPWINSYKIRIKKIALELLYEYQGAIKEEVSKFKPNDK